MTRERDIEIIMMDGCTIKEAKRHLDFGTVVYDDLEEHFEFYAREREHLGEDYIEEIKKMIESGKPATDWGIVEKDGRKYYIEYAL